MQLTLIDLNLFIVFDAIFTEGNLTRAGQKLNLSQPAISHALAKLREIMKDQLFTRQGMNMRPTPMTLSVIEQIQQALRSLEVSLHHADFDPSRNVRHYHIGMRGLLESTILSRICQLLEQSAPNLSISSVRLDRKDIEADLESGMVDLVVDIPIAMGENIRQTELTAEALVVAARRDHPLIANKLDLETYLAQKHVLVSSRRRGLGLEDSELSRHGRRRSIRVRCQDYFAASEIVSQSNLLLTMPEHCARAMKTVFSNRLYPFPLKKARISFHLYWHITAENDASNAWLRKQIERIFQKLRRAPDDLLNARAS
jgi:DNA-binding transcriptional LysR family regulator